MFNSYKKQYDEFTFDVKTKYSYNIYAPVYNYSGFNSKLPMPLLSEHGIYMFNHIEITDLKLKPKFVLVFSKRRKQAWDKNSNIPAAVFGAPFVKYRHMAGVNKSTKAKGTIAFPAHSDFLDCQEFIFDWIGYCNTLKSIPDEFHPVDICMHPNDIAKGFGSVCQEQGFKIIDASSHNPKQDFMQNFYEILRNYKYSTSNEISSSAFYSVEMDIPFFRLGNYPTCIMHEDGWTLPKGINSEPTNPVYLYAKEMFPDKPTNKITPELKKYVEDELGVYDAISPDELYEIILKYYKKGRLKRIINLPQKIFNEIFIRPIRKMKDKKQNEK